ncbi:VanW family protein [Halobacillus salinus]|uniref:VanW family protein n=1 Tax=Halobacillus salinus TaxID=192814 RepID=UPI0009A7ADC8|nr:VanW family protein [Halobacillus salinus]
MEHAKGFGLLILMTAFLLLFTYVGPMGWQLVSGEEKVYEPNTSVAGISIGGLTESEASTKLSGHVSDWEGQRDILLESETEKVRISSDFFLFDVEATLDEVVEGTDQDLVVRADESYQSEVESQWEPALRTNFEWEDWTAAVLEKASDLEEEPLVYSVYNFVPSDVSPLLETVAEYEISVKETSLLSELVSSMDTLTLKSEQEFSLIEAAEELPVSINEETLSIVATTIFGAALDTNFAIQQRHISQKLPDYAVLGREASVKPSQNDDFVLYNPNSSDYIISLSLEGSNLIVDVRGYPFVEQYFSSVEDVQAIEPRTIVRYSSFVNPSDVQVEQEGETGQRAFVYRSSRGESGIREKIAEDYYPPVNRVELRYGVEGEENNDSSGSGGDVSADDSSGNNNDRDQDAASDDTNTDTDADGETEGNPDDAKEVDPSNPIWEQDEADKEK